MLTKEEEAFLIYWENNREKQRKTYRQFLLGIPIALLFVLPIAVNFFAGWYKRADMVRGGQEFNPGVLLAALLLITGFIAIFSRRFRWDQNEQRYRELLAKKKRQPDPEKNDGGAAIG